MQTDTIYLHAPVLLRVNMHDRSAARIFQIANFIKHWMWHREVLNKPIPFRVMYRKCREVVIDVQEGENRNIVEAIVTAIGHDLVISLTCPLASSRKWDVPEIKESSSS
jgi:hypothetical protein